MIRSVILGLLMSLPGFTVRAQSRITFQLDLAPLYEKQLLLPDEAIRVFVRGSFNEWKGPGHELTRKSEEGFYSGEYLPEGQVGDTLEYKYVIERGNEKVFWESRPEPSNPGPGNRRLVLVKGPIVLDTARFCYDEYFDFPVIFSREKLQADFKQFRKILEETHPALYDYTPKEVLDSLFDSRYAAIAGAMDFNSFLMLMTEVISQVGCGHTSLWVPGDYWTVAPSKLFPLKLHPSGDQFYISGTFDESPGGPQVPVPTGSEIWSINGVPVEEIVAHLESLTSADGMNRAFRRAMGIKKFSEKYALTCGFPESFTIRYIPPGQAMPLEKVIQPVSKVKVDHGIRNQNELSMRELDQGRVALLTINTFIYYDRVPMFRSFIDSVFHVIDQKGIDQLILDLRGNGGGDPFCSSYLWGYLQKEPSPYFEDHYGRYDTLANAIPQPSEHFSGDLYTLIDGSVFSTTGHFCGLLRYHRVGKFVGSETGATFTCTGNATYPALEHTRIMVGTARVMRYTAAVKNMDPHRGIIPDYPVESTQEDLIRGRDAVLEYALSLTAGH